MRLIDADALMEIIRTYDYPLKSHSNSTDNGMFTIGIQQAVDEQPTIDAVEVVRCKDCKYAEEEKTEHPYGVLCNHATVGGYGDVFDFMHYCSYGERREE